MAKKQKIDPIEYLKGLPGLDDESKQLLAERLGKSPDALKSLQDGLMASADYQSHMAELERERQAVQAESNKYAEKLAQNELWYKEYVGSGMLDQMQQERAALQGTLAAYRQTYGDLAVPGLPNPTAATFQQPANANYVTKKDLEEFASKVATQTQDWSAGMMAKGNALAFEHFKRFGEPLDLEQLIKEAVNVSKQPASPLDMAYRNMTADRQKAADETAEKAKMEQAKKDWERDYRSRQATHQTEGEHSPLYQALRLPQAEKPLPDHNMGMSEAQRMQSFSKIWRQAGDELDSKSSNAA